MLITGIYIGNLDLARSISYRFLFLISLFFPRIASSVMLNTYLII